MYLTAFLHGKVKTAKLISMLDVFDFKMKDHLDKPLIEKMR